MQVRKEIERITVFLKNHMGDKTPVVGVSGGIDSALTLMLLKEAFPDREIKAFFMPDGKTPHTDYRDVEALGKASGTKIESIGIEAAVNAFKNMLKVDSREALGNIKSRTRMIILYYQANISNGMVVGTTNRSEYVVGYYTKYGDGACDIEPIMHLLKREVREMASELNVPKTIISKKPSAGLWEAQTDESDLGMTYEDLDDMIVAMAQGKAKKDDPRASRVMVLHQSSEHKRRMPVSMME